MHKSITSLLFLLSSTLQFFSSSVAGAPIKTATHELSESHEAMNNLRHILPESWGSALGDSGFGTAFTQSLLLILACELGDRTFFVAAILAMKNSRFIVWLGAISALGAMTVLSALLGKAFPMLLDRKLTSALAAVLFAYFGVQLLRDYARMKNEAASSNEELKEVEDELAGGDKGDKARAYSNTNVLALLSPIFVKSFSMTALAEWGDRSQIATIALAASKDMYGVILGGIIGHAVCTSLAVIGGRMLATRISERMVALIGGILFISFAIITASGKLD